MGGRIILNNYRPHPSSTLSFMFTIRPCFKNLFFPGLIALIVPAILSANPSGIVSPPPYEASATDTSITLVWQTDDPATGIVRFGKTPDYEKGALASDQLGSNHEITITGLNAAQIYQLQVGAVSGPDTTWSENQFVSTSSDPEATGDINVYFNGDIYDNAARWDVANAGVDFGSRYTNRIRNARHSVDITFYNISGSIGESIRDALIYAARFGAEVRIVMHHELGNPANNIRQDLLLEAERLNLPLKIIQSDFGDNTGLPDNRLMHNKFAIIDYKSADPADTWLITSSWNSTDPGSHEQYQNMIEFQDPAIAGGYRAEFNQMWGSDGFEPDPENARFSANKEVVNPTRFWIDDTEVDIYFSPQANTQAVITEHLRNAKYDIALPTYLITQRPYLNALESAVQAGKTVRGAIGDPSYNRSLFNTLSDIADVHDHDARFGSANNMLLHHKTAIIDASEPGFGDGQVIAGSMNWSRNGNENSDENTIIIRDERITNLYYQEFAARYQEAGGTADLTVTASDDPLYNDLPENLTLHPNYPNPFNPSTLISFDLPDRDVVSLHIYDATGRRIATLIDSEDISPGSHQITFNGDSYASGLYVLHLTTGSGHAATRTMMLVK